MDSVGAGKIGLRVSTPMTEDVSGPGEVHPDKTIVYRRICFSCLTPFLLLAFLGQYGFRPKFLPPSLAPWGMDSGWILGDNRKQESGQKGKILSLEGSPASGTEISRLRPTVQEHQGVMGRQHEARRQEGRLDKCRESAVGVDGRNSRTISAADRSLLLAWYLTLGGREQNGWP
ncbi:hypothetical protein P170DRAFT_435497 [Aspergillus steynii IBT 23096]|uniref:Uncharacterized protein n=1 Tax=Aspergillus steynii IBT 23096 TaxID=1392250 RepID=A0A2I2GBP3_9EURO|nr:uncharacterized protein P170DRAFT_435497 [Aspergillus steynii IBT 23096]PLB50296.1 hypothetical protein P170DRAFT_435497 [Aspergillus steynii IBT 23096]